ncbi:hypothetical protein [Rhodohalobacter barkolensis]|uniref:Uncharacterized protein n=1 Tax=Rhodohalobacter barkolensis TaxID=2053187 RepID=A0A2N0VE36_9BACT|nr:hypothetical protein [Rhodohalobacter barkolensis]PKD42461.1 hypothetical protein CWD77_13665 [Rhodohalobacter barkolensis]
MKISTTTYQRFTNATALLLLIAFLIPAGLQAKQLVDFCMMDMGHHNTMEMADDHSCCTEKEPVHHDQNDDSSHSHECESLGICACNTSQPLLKDADWTIVTNEFSVILPKKTYLTPFITSDEPITFSNAHNLSQYKPPLWLMYDTFLM